MFKQSFILQIIGILLFSPNVFSQGIEKCASHKIAMDAIATDNKIAASRQAFETGEQEWRTKNSGNLMWDTTVTYIPVVVHVLYNLSQENISDNQIFSQIDILNKDFRRLNSDTTSGFSSVAADTKIEFRLANKDPMGNYTSGITRTWTSVSSFGTDTVIFYSSAGGKTMWDRNCYLNLYVAKLSSGSTPNLYGYAFLPGTGSSTKDGIVIDYRCFGNIGTAMMPTNKGRTASHEVGHFFNLNHIWGDGAGCTPDDGVADTPLQSNATFNCPSAEVTDLCAASSPGIMFQNYMDYTEDACMNMFTQGQKTKMVAALNIAPRNSLTTCSNIGIENVSLENSVSIFPNPSTGVFQISGLQHLPAFDVSFFNVLGKEVFSKSNSKNAAESTRVDLSGIPSGFYFVKISSGDKVFAKKIIVGN